MCVGGGLLGSRPYYAPLRSILPGSMQPLVWMASREAKRGCAILAKRLGFTIDRTLRRRIVEPDTAVGFPAQPRRDYGCGPSLTRKHRRMSSTSSAAPAKSRLRSERPLRSGGSLALARREPGVVVAPDGSELTRLILAEDPAGELARLIARYVPVTCTLSNT